MGYNQDDLDSAGITEDQIKGMYYFSESSNQWRLYSESGDDDAEGCISTTTVDKENDQIVTQACHLTQVVVGEAPGPNFKLNYTGLDSFINNIEGQAEFKISQVDGINDSTPIRYKALLKKDGVGVVGQEIYYPISPGDSRGDWTSFDTITGGVAYFGPSTGFTLSDLSPLEDETGITTPFATTLPAGEYTISIGIVEVIDGGYSELAMSEDIQFEVQKTQMDFAYGSETGINGYDTPIGQCDIYTNDTSVSGKALQVLKFTTVSNADYYLITGYTWNGNSWRSGSAYDPEQYALSHSGVEFEITDIAIYTTGATRENSYTYQVVAYDENDNPVGQSPVVNTGSFDDPCVFTVDRTSPSAPTGITIKDHQSEILGCSGYTNNRQISIDWNDNLESDLDYYRYDIKDKNDFKHLSSSLITGKIRDQDGEYKYRVWAVDLAGNESENSSGWCSVILDRQAPSVPDLIFPNPGQYLNSSNLYVDWSPVSDPSSPIRYEYRLYLTDPEENPNASIRYSKDYLDVTRHPQTGFAPGTPESTYWWRIRACDQAGNCSLWSNSRSFIVDNTPPRVEITSPLSGYLSDVVNITGTITEENLSHYNLSLNPDDGTCNTESTWNFSNRVWQESGSSNSVSHILDTESLDDGNYVIRLAARDEAGNRDPMSNTGTGDSVDYACVTIDNTPPESVFNSNNKMIFGGPEETPITLSGQSTDTPQNTVDHVDIYGKLNSDEDLKENWTQINSIENTEHKEPFNWQFEITPLQDGIFDFKAQATDKAGNVETTAHLEEIIYDTTPPKTLDWVNPVNNATLSGDQPLEVNATDSLSKVETISYAYEQVNGGLQGSTSSPWGTKSLPLDYYILKAVATDKAGNQTEKEIEVGVTAILSSQFHQTTGFEEIEISWTTDRPTSGRVVYDTVPHLVPDLSDPNFGYAFTTAEKNTSSKTTTHYFKISGLNVGTTYYFRLISSGSPKLVSDEYSNQTFSKNFSEPAPASPPSDGGGAGDTGGDVLGAQTTTDATHRLNNLYALADTSLPDTNQKDNDQGSDQIDQGEVLAQQDTSPSPTQSDQPTETSDSSSLLAQYWWLLVVLLSLIGLTYLVFKKPSQ